MEAEPYEPLPPSDPDDWRDPNPLRCSECMTILDQSKIVWSDFYRTYFGVCPSHGRVEAILRSAN